jgi:hypothetical protein
MKMNKLPTAEEFYFEITQCHINHRDVKTAMIEFAKLHVRAALETAATNSKTKEEIAIFMEGTYKTSVVDKESILNTYNESNIK